MHCKKQKKNKRSVWGATHFGERSIKGSHAHNIPSQNRSMHSCCLDLRTNIACKSQQPVNLRRKYCGYALISVLR